jgi:hypothetical protein
VMDHRSVASYFPSDRRSECSERKAFMRRCAWWVCKHVCVDI